MEQQLQNLPIGIETFSEIRSNNYLYVDKTAFVYHLQSSGKYYFLSRPRRFGKSLFLSTLQSYFEGRKDLFQGLAIEQLENKWEKYPVLRLNLNTGKYTDPSKLEEIIDKHLSEWESCYAGGVGGRSLETRFESVILQAYKQTGRAVVILIDEYDKPLLQAIGNEALQAEYRATLKAFYGVMKTMDQYIRFAFLTGVTKFSKVSIFSDLNNLNDISLSAKYQEICGISEKELLANFKPYIQRMAKKYKYTQKQTVAELKRMYDGYRFSPEAKQGVYNPFSLLNAFYQFYFGSYWFATGTPTFLVELLQSGNYELPSLEGISCHPSDIDSIDSALIDPIAVLYQSGYLTISGINKTFGSLLLDFPNEEVRVGFLRFLLPHYIKCTYQQATSLIEKFVQAVFDGNTDAFFTRMKSCYANTPYELIKDTENHYQNVMYLVCRLMGLFVEVERHSSYGVADMIIKAPNYIYVMEFKFDGSAEDALQQIKDKGYAQPFATDPRKVLLVGVNFSKETRNIDKWVVEEMEK